MITHVNSVHLKKSSMLSLLLTALLLTGCSQKQTDPNAYVSKTGFFLDTVVSITLYGTKETAPLEECFSMLASYEALLSRTREGSDVWNINHSNGKPVSISVETADLLQTALDYCEQSQGAFDITIAPVLSLWNFQPEQHSGTVPDEAALTAALTHVDYRKVQLNGTTVRLLDADAAIDLGAIAKGYIADRLRDALLLKGYPNALISLGGNILTMGSKPDGTPWNIGIRKPFTETNELLTTVYCTDRSVVTSGTYERYFRQDGMLYHHILNPETGYPAKNGLASVTILSENSVDGDALSTACFVLGPEKGMKLAESLDGIEAMFVTEDLELHCSSGWPATR